MRHKFADLIHAWADGAQIEWRPSDDAEWRTAEHPNWGGYQYRIKPVSEVRWLTVLSSGPSSLILCNFSLTKKGALDYLDNRVAAALRIEINPGTMELVSAVMEKV